jgi:Ca2+-binding EF-hand superfamily protein
MTGEGWDSISDLAKDLLTRILNRDKDERLTCGQILQHPWMQGHAPATSLGTDYFTRIKHLVLRQKFKTFFLENDITEDNKSRRSELEGMLPFLRQPAESECSMTDDAEDAEVTASRKASDLENSEELQKFRDKLVVLRAFMIEALVTQKGLLRGGAGAGPGAAAYAPAEVETASSGMSSSTLGLPAPPAAPVEGEVDYHVFVDILKRADLMELASPAVFNIFDIGKTRTIDLKEFLTTMLAFRPVGADTDAVRLYFNIFDINDSGCIDKDELRICLELLLMDDSSRLESSAGCLAKVDELFSAMDFTNSGTIDFHEFKTFYETVLTATTLTTSSAGSATEHMKNVSPPARALAPLSEEGPDGTASAPETIFKNI